jgi:hypothetical protein
LVLLIFTQTVEECSLGVGSGKNVSLIFCSELKTVSLMTRQDAIVCYIGRRGDDRGNEATLIDIGGVKERRITWGDRKEKLQKPQKHVQEVTFKQPKK